MTEKDTRQIIQEMFGALDIRDLPDNHISGTVKKEHTNAIFLNGRECTTAVRANEDEGWVEMLIVSSIEDGLPSFAHEEGLPYKTILYGKVEVIKINRRNMI